MNTDVDLNQERCSVLLAHNVFSRKRAKPPGETVSHYITSVSLQTLTDMVFS